MALPNGNDVKSRSAARVVEANRWDAEAINKIKGIPGDMIANESEDVDPAIEESATPHLDGDAEARDSAELHLPTGGWGNAKEPSKLK